MGLPSRMIDELVRLVAHELDALHDPYTWPPVRFCDLPDDVQREHRRLRAVEAALVYRGNVAEYEEQEEARANGALYPSRAEWLDVWREALAESARTVLPSEAMATQKTASKGRKGNPEESPWRSPTAAQRKTPKFSTTVPADTQARLAELATEWGTSLGGVIVRLVRDHDEKA